MFYTGIGSRETPPDVVDRMKDFASKMAMMNATLRSGGANGADLAFETGCDDAHGNKEIYLPWEGFNNSKSEYYDCYHSMHSVIAQRIYGPRWNVIRDSVKKLMTRNVAQIMGIDNKDIKYSEFVVCWTPDGCESARKRTRATGGTGQAISLADELRIPVFNMFNETFDQRFAQHMNHITLFQ